MVLNDYQKKLIAEGLYSRLMDEDSPDKRILMIVEFMDSFTPKGLPSTIPLTRDGTMFEWPKENISPFSSGG